MRTSVAVDPSGSAVSRATSTTVYAPPDEKLLDLELQGQESARNAFVRDLKLALLFVLLFQLLILPRFVRLSDATQTNRTNLDTLKTQSNATHELRTVLESLQSVLKRGAVLTSKHLANTAEQMHQQTSRLDSEIRELRNSAAPGPAPSRPNMIVQTTRAAEIRLLSDLPPEQTRQVASNDPQVFRAAISPIVRTKIIQPAFADLNSQLISLLRQPFAVGRQRVESVLEAQNRNLKSAGTDPDSIRRQLSAEQDRLNDIRFIMPESDLWWATVQSKEGFFDQQNVSSRNVTDELQRQLSRLNHENAATETKIAALLHDTEANQEMLQAQMKKLEETMQTAQDALADEAKPFKLLAIPLRDAVLYFPVAIALVWAYLTCEYAALGTRVRRLREAYSRLGYGPAALKLYFAPVPGTTTVSASVAALLFALPIAICLLSAHRIQRSVALNSAAPGTLYLLAEILLFGCFLVSLLSATRVALSFRQ